jgi:hypothetical protein
MAATDVLTGARVGFFWGDLPVAFAAGLNGEENIEYAPVEVLNSLEVVEHTPVAYRCSFNASMFRRIATNNKGPRVATNGEISSVNSGEQEHARNTPNDSNPLIPKINDILVTEGVSAYAQADNGADTLYTFTESKCTSRSFDIPARGQVVENLAFVAIRLQTDEDDT